MRLKKSKVYDELIQCKRWRDVRAAYLTEHPLCERCKREGIVRAATEVHHLLEVELGRTRVEMEARAYSTANLQAYLWAWAATPSACCPAVWTPLSPLG